MKKVRLLSIMFLAMTLAFSCNRPEPEPQPELPVVEDPDTTEVGIDTTNVEEPRDNIYQFNVLAGTGDSVSLGLYRGQVLLVVNTATQCGYTPQYTQLEQWYQNYQDQGFVILDFPCNQFGSQAPGDYDDIHGYCTSTYNITFPQFAKIIVNGVNASPLYVWLKSKIPGSIQWNFTKFLINRQGEVVARFEPEQSMNTVRQAIEAEIAR